MSHFTHLAGNLLSSAAPLLPNTAAIAATAATATTTVACSHPSGLSVAWRLKQRVACDVQARGIQAEGAGTGAGAAEQGGGGRAGGGSKGGRPEGGGATREVDNRRLTRTRLPPSLQASPHPFRTPCNTYLALPTSLPSPIPAMQVRHAGPPCRSASIRQLFPHSYPPFMSAGPRSRSLASLRTPTAWWRALQRCTISSGYVSRETSLRSGLTSHSSRRRRPPPAHCSCQMPSLPVQAIECSRPRQPSGCLVESIQQLI